MEETQSARSASDRNPGRGMIRVAGALALVASAAIVIQAGVGPSGLASPAAASAPRLQAVATAPARDPTLRLLTQGQYVNTIASIFGSDIAVKVRFAPLQRVNGLLAVGASSAVMTGGSFDPLEASARVVAEQVVSPERRAFLIPCEPANPKLADEKCARAFFSEVGRLLYRRPLTDAELNDVVGIAGRAATPAGDFYGGLAFALSGMMVSPQFLYIWENIEPGTAQLDGYSRASRLSFLLWNAGPDDALLSAAAHGDLQKPEGLRRQVDRMIASPRYQDGVRAFFSDFLVMEAFDTLAKDGAMYPAMTIKAIGEAREQMLRTIVDHLVTQHGDYRDLFTTRRTFLSSDLAVLYKTPVSTGSQGWIPYEFPANDPRAGILSEIGFLAQYAHPARSSSTRRGRAIREVLLCQKVPDAPPNVDFSNFENPASPLPTARQRLTAHQANPVCAGCHRVMDPIGLALENFDGAGQFRDTERGAAIDASGTLDGVTFQNPAGLGKAIRDNPSLKSCVVNRLYSYSVGHKADDKDEPLLEQYQTALDKRGYRFDDMLRLLIFDRSFFSVRPAQTADAIPTTTASKGGSNAH